ncbi:MAG TPA: DUF3105 domain-containing protein [Gaiellaceae bacterium]|nr:DUF3105 domain-containing protein [Gaiellaceae bacterium]
MAKKKNRTPAPPRPVQAPKRRFEARNPRRTRIYLIALGALAALLVTSLLAFTLRDGKEDAKAALAEGGCTRATPESQGQRHVEKLPQGFKYNSVPATSGPHQPQPLAPIVWGVYDEPVEQVKVVHNLEHGGVIVQYGPEVPAQTVQEIVAWYRDDPNGLVVAPLTPALIEEKPELSDEIALTAWIHLQTCKRFNDEAFSNFVDLYRGNGPERFPVSVLSPGSQ